MIREGLTSDLREKSASNSLVSTHGSIYAFWKSSFLKYNNRLGKTCRPFIMPEERTINIDEPIDLELAKILIKNKETNDDYCSRLDGGCNNDW